MPRFLCSFRAAFSLCLSRARVLPVSSFYFVFASFCHLLSLCMDARCVLSLYCLVQLNDTIAHKASRVLLAVASPLGVVLALALSQISFLQWGALGITGFLLVGLAISSGPQSHGT